MNNIPARFCLGRIVATPGALAALRNAGDEPEPLLARHQLADFGDLGPLDVHEQTLALQQEHDPDQRQPVERDLTLNLLAAELTVAS